MHPDNGSNVIPLTPLNVPHTSSFPELIRTTPIAILDVRPTPRQTKKPRNNPMTPQQKIHEILGRMDELNMNLGEFLFHLFARPPKTESPNPSKKPEAQRPTLRHYQTVGAFLRGTMSRKPIEILQLMYSHPFSKPKRAHEESDLYFSTTTLASSIKFARPAFSTWAAEITIDALVRNTRDLAAKKSGLHLRAGHNARAKEDQVTAATWERIHQATSGGSWMETLLRTTGPLLWHTVLCMLESAPRRRKRDFKGEYHPVVQVSSAGSSYLFRYLTIWPTDLYSCSQWNCLRKQSTCVLVPIRKFDLALFHQIRVYSLPCPVKTK